VCFLIKLCRTYEKSLERLQQIVINNAPKKLITKKKKKEVAKD
jgi:hypothetical protein